MSATPYKPFFIHPVTTIANGAEGNAVTTQLYVPWANEGYGKGTIIFTLESTTITLFGSADEDSVALASQTWRDIMQSVFGVVNLTTSGELIFDTDVDFARLRITSLTTNATNSRSIRIVKKG